MGFGNIGIWLHSGLGNQLFMIFATVSYALDHGMKYVIYSPMDKIGYRNTYWDSLFKCFKDVVRPYDDAKGEIYQEPNFHYEKLPDMSNKHIMLKGYFQSAKYFEHNFDKICDMIGLRQKIADVKAKYEPIISFKNKKWIAMHFRIEDYIGLQYNHPIQRPDYYVKALLQLESDLESKHDNINNYNILYFCQPCDDHIVDKYLAVIKDHIDYNGLFVKAPHYIEDWESMLLMSCCDHFIIANSTFSWFGAYFSDKTDKKVYFPSAWFGPGLTHNKTHDLCPIGWKKIEAAPIGP